MRLLFLAILGVFVVPAIVSAQQRGSASVCLNDVPPGVLLNICQHEYGMAALPTPRLNLRLYKDGRGEYEENRTWNTLSKKAFRAKEEDVHEIERLGATEGVQKAPERYPVYNVGDDSATVKTVDIYGETGRKRIVLDKFFCRRSRKQTSLSRVAYLVNGEDRRNIG